MPPSPSPHATLTLPSWWPRSPHPPTLTLPSCHPHPPLMPPSPSPPGGHAHPAPLPSPSPHATLTLPSPRLRSPRPPTITLPSCHHHPPLLPSPSPHATLTLPSCHPHPLLPRGHAHPPLSPSPSPHAHPHPPRGCAHPAPLPSPSPHAHPHPTLPPQPCSPAPQSLTLPSPRSPRPPTISTVVGVGLCPSPLCRPLPLMGWWWTRRWTVMSSGSSYGMMDGRGTHILCVLIRHSFPTGVRYTDTPKSPPPAGRLPSRPAIPPASQRTPLPRNNDAFIDSPRKTRRGNARRHIPRRPRHLTPSRINSPVCWSNRCDHVRPVTKDRSDLCRFMFDDMRHSLPWYQALGSWLGLQLQLVAWVFSHPV